MGLATAAVKIASQAQAWLLEPFSLVDSLEVGIQGVMLSPAAGPAFSL
jgi:hypothetical protein